MPVPVLPPRAVPPAPPQPRRTAGLQVPPPGRPRHCTAPGPRSAPGLPQPPGGAQLAPAAAGSTPAPHGSSFGPAEPALPVNQGLPRARCGATVPARPSVTARGSSGKRSLKAVPKKGCSAASLLLSAPLLLRFPKCQARSGWAFSHPTCPAWGNRGRGSAPPAGRPLRGHQGKHHGAARKGKCWRPCRDTWPSQGRPNGKQNSWGILLEIQEQFG